MAVPVVVVHVLCVHVEQTKVVHYHSIRQYCQASQVRQQHPMLCLVSRMLMLTVDPLAKDCDVDFTWFDMTVHGSLIFLNPSISKYL